MKRFKSAGVIGGILIAMVLAVALYAQGLGQGRGGGQGRGQAQGGGEAQRGPYLPVNGQEPSLAVCYGLLAGARNPPPGTAPCRAITRVRGDLYSVQVNRYNTVFLVTPAGVILADPINVETATWLKEEIAQRFHVPVKYVVYSEVMQDHSSGAGVFHDTAEIWAHADLPKDLLLETEALGADRTKDIVPPDKTYTTRQTLTLGGKSVVLMHPGINHSNDATVLLFPAERVAFIVDFISTRRPFASELYPPLCKYCTATFTDWINSFKAVEALDFDLFVAGHGMVGTKADVTLYRRFFEEMVTGVTNGFKAGETLEQIQASDLLESYSWLLGYNPSRNQKMAEAYAYLQATQGNKTAQAGAPAASRH